MRNTCVRIPQTGCITQVVALFIISQDRQTRVLAAVAMTTTIIIDYNSWFPWSLSPAKCSTASACNNPSDSITEIVRLEQLNYYNQKQNEVLYVNMENMDLLPPTSFSRARLTRPIGNVSFTLENEGWGGAGSKFCPCWKTGLCFVLGFNNRTVHKLCL